MADTPANAGSTNPDSAGDDTPRYPTNSVLGVIDSEEQVEAAVVALTGAGFPADEIRVSTGQARADALQATTGRSGLANIAERIAERLGIEDSEMEYKAHCEQAMRDGRFVVIVPAADDARTDRAVALLRAHDAHAVSFHGRYSIESIVPPRGA